jgi:hypothetical protein
LENLEVLGEGDCEIKPESFDELMISSDAKNWTEEMIEARYFPLGCMYGRVVFICSSACDGNYA